MADCILVNSKYTAEVFRDTFRSSQVNPVVLYPSINLSAYDVPPPDGMRQ
jgi:alpha-1,3/alpha-1,6-mannosyltransferase